jgi:hypothetical protein
VQVLQVHINKDTSGYKYDRRADIKMRAALLTDVLQMSPHVKQSRSAKLRKE